jgi:hypothetical protein
MAHARKGTLRGQPIDEHIRIDDEGRAVRVVDTHHRYGGFDAGASIAGALTALGVTVLLGGLLGGIGTIGYQLDLQRGTDELSIAGLAGGLVTLIAAFLVGGWVAGRIARYDGGRNGLMTAVWFILAAAALAVLGAWLGDRYDVFAGLQVPQWFSDNATTATAVISGLVAALVMLGAGFVGGLIGARYHARADAYLAAEERDRLTGGEPLETIGADGKRHITGQGPTLAAEPSTVDLRDTDRTRADGSTQPADDAAEHEVGERTPTDRGR